MPEPFTLYKLIILYMLQKVDFPLTHSQISEFILDRGYTTYFTFQSVMSELMDSEMIRQETILNTTYYSLTEAGAEALHYFQNRISKSIRDDIDQYITENKMQLRDEVSVVADYYKNTANEYSVRCLVKEKYSNPIDLTITVPDEAQARIVCRNWKQKCQQIYEYVMKELL
ncbi:MAG: DUF4364 family protein [Lachnospiraceae bacterium]|nr:DUF4364 family protein [Lachnospiraceae bacterium]MDD7077579.1 DUF4364 family protein [Lachnospiraceae bacterium]MDY3730796.1 DUF4364 family protein [Candidatus Choladocola sp.]